MSKELIANSTVSHYRIVEKIGAGGMGEVYLAEDTTLERQVALKVLLAEVAADEDRVRRFVQEAKAASALNHPNILTVHEIGTFENSRFIATELIKGETLRERLKIEPLDLRQTLDVAAQIAAALNAAHQAGIVHRDIKPENVMIRDDGFVKVLDFGLAKLTEKKTQTLDSEGETRALEVKTSPGVVMGTVSYMSPEQARGRETDARSDVWSLGVVIYEMLSGRTPFEGETTNDTIAAILTREPAPLAENVPHELQRIIRKSLQKDKNERYQTVKDFLLDVKNLKRELEFAEELERSQIPHSMKASNVSTNQSSENATAILAAAVSTQNSLPPATSSAEYIAQEVKKHKRGIMLFGLPALLLLVGVGFWLAFNRAAANKQIESIAVMPFVNESGNPELEYLSDGMTETLISSLSQLPNLNIKPRSIVFRYKGREADPQTIGKELNVQAVLNGRVASRGADLLLFVELIDVASTKVIWSQQYNRKQNEIVSLQSEIARDISSKLKTGITNEEETKVTKNYTDNPEAYRLYLRGNSLSSRRKSKDVRMAIEAYEQAIALDPKYALAYSGLANAHLFMVIYGGAPPMEEFSKARAAAMKALELDPTLPGAHAALGAVTFFQDRDFNALEQGTRRALELSPNNANAYRQNGLRLAWLGRFDEAIASHRRSLEIEPLSLVTVVNYAWCLFYAGRVDESDAQLKVAQEIDPSFWYTEYQLFVNSRAKGDYASAAEHLARAHELRDEPETAKFIRDAFQKGGWRGLIESTLASPEGSKMLAYERATFAAELGKKDKAFALLGEAYDKHDQFIFFMKIDPFMGSLRGDPRFDELLKKLGFPE